MVDKCTFIIHYCSVFVLASVVNSDSLALLASSNSKANRFVLLFVKAFSSPDVILHLLLLVNFLPKPRVNYLVYKYVIFVRLYEAIEMSAS